MNRSQDWRDKWFKDDQGNWAVMQPANTPAVVTAIGIAVTFGLYLLGLNHLAQYTGAAACGVTAYWAWLELTSGVNYFRRLLGAIVLLGVMAVAVLYILSHNT